MNFSAHHYINRGMPLSNDDVARIAPAIFAGHAHESRSDRYAYIPTDTILNGMRKAGFEVVNVRQSNTRDESREGFTKHMIRFRKSGYASALQNVGDVFPEVVLVNSHDGTSSYQLMAGMFRRVCSNGLIVGAGQLDTVRVSHSGNVLDKVIEGSYRVLQASERALIAPEAWSKIRLSESDQLALAEAAHVLRFGDAEGVTDTPILPRQLLAIRRQADTANDLWTTFNVVQENTIRGGLSARAPRRPGEYRGRRVTSRQVNGIDQDVRLNKALWVLADRMASLKQAA